MPDYEAPTLLELRTSVRRDLRDFGETIFPTEQVTDFINEGIAELNRIKPIEIRETYDQTADYTTVQLPFSHIWRVELVNNTHSGQTFIPRSSAAHHQRNGWDYFGRILTIGQGYGNIVERELDNAACTLVVWGYRDRDPLTDDLDIFEGDLDDEMLLRKFTRVRGLRSLSDDRSLFQQWQTQANNSDVSPTQLLNMAAQAEGEWDRARRRAFRPRRVA